MLHPRNKHKGRYDLEKLKKALPEFAAFVIKTPYGDDSIDFANPEAVKIDNRATRAVSGRLARRNKNQTEIKYPIKSYRYKITNKIKHI